MVTHKHIAFATSDASLREVAEQAAARGASALGSALWAYLTAAASHEGVLLSPLAILLVGFGAKRAFDGRCRQPGLGASRPRGFKSDEPVPDAARVAIPGSLAAVFVAQSYDEGAIRSLALKAAVSAAKACGAPRRAALFAKAQAFGPGAFKEGDVQSALLRMAGPPQGGLVTAEDFAALPDVDWPAESVDDHVELPFAGEDSEAYGAELEPQAVVALDRRGTAVVLSYARAKSGVALLDGELIAPRIAVPVMRGVPRVKPGSALPVHATARILLDASGVPLSASSVQPTLNVFAPR